MLQFQSMKKGIILFDIDRTILDTEKMIKMFDVLLLSILNNPSYYNFKKAETDYFKTLTNERYFNVPDYAQFLSTRFGKDVDKSIVNVFYSSEHKHIYSDCVFKEAIEIFEMLKEWNLGIYSEGTNDFQNNKFDSMNLNKYFSKDLVFIVDAKDTKEVLKRIPTESIIIDDKETICQFLTDSGIRAIWINRKDKRKSDNFETIYSLLELPAIL